MLGLKAPWVCEAARRAGVVLRAITYFFSAIVEPIGWPAFLFPGCLRAVRAELLGYKRFFSSDVGSCSFRKRISIFGD